MSIGIACHAKTRRKDLLIREVGKVALDNGYDCVVDEDSLTVSFCPMGELTMEWKREGGLRGTWLVRGECCSTPAGAGLHAACIRFLDALGKTVLKDLTVSDDTDYHKHRDFTRMKQEHFYPWLNTLKELSEKQGSEYGNFCLCWDLNQYQPEEIEGS